MISYDRLPEHMQDAARRYVEHGASPSDFLSAVLCHDLVRAFQYADDINAACMRDWAMWLFNDLPGICHGNIGAVRAWVRDTDGIRTEALERWGVLD